MALTVALATFTFLRKSMIDSSLESVRKFCTLTPLNRVKFDRVTLKMRGVLIHHRAALETPDPDRVGPMLRARFIDEAQRDIVLTNPFFFQGHNPDGDLLSGGPPPPGADDNRVERAC